MIVHMVKDLNDSLAGRGLRVPALTGNLDAATGSLFRLRLSRAITRRRQAWAPVRRGIPLHRAGRVIGRIYRAECAAYLTKRAMDARSGDPDIV